MIRQFDVVPNPVRSGREDRPYLLVIQHYFYDHYVTRVCAPLVTRNVIRKLTRLNPELRVKNEILYLSPTDLATFSLRHLREPVANLESERNRIIAALDLVFTGI